MRALIGGREAALNTIIIIALFSGALLSRGEVSNSTLPGSRGSGDENSVKGQASIVNRNGDYPVPEFWAPKMFGAREYWFKLMSDYSRRIVDRNTWQIQELATNWWFQCRGGAADTYGMSELIYDSPLTRFAEMCRLPPGERARVFDLYKKIVVEDFASRKMPFVLWDFRQQYDFKKFTENKISSQEWKDCINEIEKVSDGMFCGFATKEWDNTWLGRAKSGRYQFNQAKDCPTRRDFWKYFSEKLMPWEMNLRGCPEGVPTAMGLGGFSIESFWFYELGRKLCVTELRCDPLGFDEFPFARGAGRQYDKPWGIWAGLRSGMNPVYSVAKTNAVMWKNIVFSRPDHGFSRQHELLMKLVPYMAGANLFLWECGPLYFSDYDGDGKYILNNPRGEDVYRCVQFIKRHPDRGMPYTPVGVLMDWASGWRKGVGRKFGVVPYQADDFMEDVFWQAVFPHDMCGQLDALNEKSFQMPSPYGDVFDVLLPNPPSGAITQDKLNGYRVLIMLAEINLDDKLAARLKQYVADGGTLVVNVMQLNNGLEKTEFTGLEVTDEKITARSCRNLLNKKNAEGGEFTCRKARMAGAEALMEDPESGLPLVTRNKIGKGQVVVTLAEWMAENNTKPMQDYTDSGRSYPKKKGVCFWPDLMEALTVDLLPVRISGAHRAEQLWYMANKKHNGWLVTLVNQAGFSKDITDELSEYCPDKRLDLSLSFNGKPLEAREWTIYGDNKLAAGSSGEVATVAVRLDPGEIKVIEFRSSDAPDRYQEQVPVNLALGKKASASSSVKVEMTGREKSLMGQTGGRVENFNPELGTDGKTDILNGWLSEPGFPQWYEVDLGKEYPIGRVVLKTLYAKDPTWRVYFRYTLEVSKDRKEWKKVADMTDNNDTAPEIGYQYWVGGESARYVRVLFTDASRAWYAGSVREIEVYPYDPAW